MTSDDRVKRSEIRVEALREGMTMVLYLSIVLLATFASLPSGTEESTDGGHSGIHGARLVGLIWGTAVGLALAHWFAFRLTARLFGKGRITEKDLVIGLAQIAGAVLVATLCTLPVLIVDEGYEIRAASWVPALIVGVVGYAIARLTDRTRMRAFILGGVAMLLGLTVAAVKNFLIGH